MEYMLITDSDPNALVQRVKGYILKGWIPQGGISITMLEHSIINIKIMYAQAMIKKDMI